ncbi:MAG: hypothetical protein IPQ07_10445 [Myxococcales bacterium]|nr:hypothetical protein [Myxococcales bacterium]
MQRASAFLAASLAMVAPAAADRFSVHGTASLDAAVTDNVFSAERGAANRDSDLFFTIRPGALLTYALPRMMHELNAELEMMRYVVSADQPTIAFRGGWKSLYLPGPRSEVLTQANVSKSILSAISASSSPNDTVAQLQPVGQVDVLQGDANEYGSYTATREIRLSQTLFARAGKTDDNGDPQTIVTSAEAGATFGIDRSFRKSTLSLELGASVLRLERDADPGASMGPRLDRQINPRARMQWRRDLSRKLSSAIDGGVAIVLPYGTDPDNPDVTRHVGTFPLVGAQLAYTDLWGIATLAVRRDVTPNLFVAANTVNDTASLAAAMPLSWFESSRRRQPKLAGVGSFGISRTQLIQAETSDLQSSFVVGRVDAGLQYAPRPGITYSARYEFMYQTQTRGAGLGMAIPGFFRNTIYITAAIRFPADVAVRVPKRRAGSVRADRKDLTPVGAEPVIPDLVEAGSEGGSDE